MSNERYDASQTELVDNVPTNEIRQAGGVAQTLLDALRQTGYAPERRGGTRHNLYLRVSDG